MIVVDTVKTCFKCRTPKPIAEFYRHPRMADGHLGKCKDCTKKDVRENRLARVDYYKQFEAIRSRNPDRKAKAYSYGAASRRRHPDRYSARNAVNNAVRDGRLTRLPCEVCGETDGVEAHHEDYSRPLVVRWLCFAHHRETHGQCCQ
jgi:hypothetical protein